MGPNRLSPNRPPRHSRPLQGRLLKGFASELDAKARAQWRAVIAQGFAEGKSASAMARELMRGAA